MPLVVERAEEGDGALDPVTEEGRDVYLEKRPEHGSSEGSSVASKRFRSGEIRSQSFVSAISAAPLRIQWSASMLVGRSKLHTWFVEWPVVESVPCLMFVL